MLKEIKTSYFADARFHLAISEKEDRAVEDAMIFARAEDWIKVIPLSAKYPQDDPLILIKVILDMDVNFGQDTTSLGILILDAQTVSAMYEQGIMRKDVNSRYVVLSGTGLREKEIIRAELGTSVEKILKNKVKDANVPCVYERSLAGQRNIRFLTENRLVCQQHRGFRGKVPEGNVSYVQGG